MDFNARGQAGSLTGSACELVNVVPALALAAASQVAALAVSHAARITEAHAGRLVTSATEGAVRFASLAEGLADHVSDTTDAGASVAQQQAARMAVLAENIAVHVSQRAQDSAQCLSAIARQSAEAANTYARQSSVRAEQQLTRLASGTGTSTAGPSPWQQPADPSSTSMSSAATAAAAPSRPPPQGAAAAVTTLSASVSSGMGSTSASAASTLVPAGPASAAPRQALHASTSAGATSNAYTSALASAIAACTDAESRLVVRSLVHTIFTSVLNQAWQQQLTSTTSQFQLCLSALESTRQDLNAAQAELQAARQQLQQLPDQMMAMLQEQMRRSMREGLVEVVRDALASPEPQGPHHSQADAAQLAIVSLANPPAACEMTVAPAALSAEEGRVAAAVAAPGPAAASGRELAVIQHEDEGSSGEAVTDGEEGFVLVSAETE